MGRKINNRKKIEELLLICVFSFFVFMMIFHITHSALWGDEWVEYDYSQVQIMNGDMYDKIISTYQPPLYNFVMHFWLKINQTVLWFRCFNILPGFVSGIFLFLTLKELINEKIACISLCILSVSFQWVYCIQECSEYALMLNCLFGTLYFYVMTFQKFSYKRMLLFVFYAVLTVYSQYGGGICILPLLVLFFIGNINKTVDKQRKKIIIILYAISFFVFAIPLYYFFLQKQMVHNQISGHEVSLTFDLLKDVPFVMGKLIGYFYNLESEGIWELLWSILSLCFIIMTVFILLKGKLDWNKRSLITVLWISYFLHYILVQKHIYAMVHPDQSAGFFERYSYFYIPLLCIVLPVIITEFNLLIEEERSIGLYRISIGVVIVICAFLSFYAVLPNWNKALDDQFALIWLKNEGWKDKTYLYGTASYGFNYYISHSDEYEEGYLDNVVTSVDNNNLPMKFWAWRTNWSGDGWKTTIDKASSLGYTVTIYNDSGYAGQLAYCSYDANVEKLDD